MVHKSNDIFNILFLKYRVKLHSKNVWPRIQLFFIDTVQFYSISTTHWPAQNTGALDMSALLLWWLYKL